MMWGYGYGYPMMGYGFGWLGAIFGIVWAIILVLIIVGIIRWVRGGPYGHHRHFFNENTALTILKERYARGEIDKEEFESKKKDLIV